MSKLTMKLGNVTVPQGLSKKDLLKFLVENKAILIAEKKAENKKADGITIGCDISKVYYVDKDGKLNKGAADATKAAEGQETVLVVINTTNWFDSHKDVHIPGLWNKSLSDNPTQLHLQEHDMSFAAVISDSSTAYTDKLTWKQLGYDYPGVTEALIFSTPFTGRNPFMEDQYRKGFVKNHSVGMRYVSIKLCVNEPEDDYYKEEYANWVQYAPMVVNLADAEADGFFWAVTEAKVIEGSAVVKGSNIITPTLGFKSAEPPVSTQHKKPADATSMESEANLNKVADYFLKQTF